MSKLCEVRSLMTEALQVANVVFDQGAPPELHVGLEYIKNLLDCALGRLDGAMYLPDPVWPGLAARA